MKEPQILPHVRAMLDPIVSDFAPETEFGHVILPSKSNHNCMVITAEDLPVPRLIQYTLTKVLGFSSLGPAEKVRWSIPFRYKRIKCTLAYQKFGLRLYIAVNDISIPTSYDSIKQEIVKKLKKALQIIEKHVLKDYANSQLCAGNVTVVNDYLWLDHRYKYFREQAFLHKGTEDFSFHNALAMFDAYFSRLEHLLVIILPFVKFNPDEDNLSEIISSGWQKKYQRIFPMNGSARSAKKYYDELLSIKECLRNKYTHGNFGKDNELLYFHLPEIRPISAKISKENSSDIHFIPIGDAGLNDVCYLLDEFDQWLESGEAKFGVLYAKSGFDVPFDLESIREFQIAMNSPDNFNLMLEYCEYMLDMHSNMEYD